MNLSFSRPLETCATSTSLAGWASSAAAGTTTGLLMAGILAGWRGSGISLGRAAVLPAAGHDVHAGGEQQRGDLAPLLPELEGELAELLQVLGAGVHGPPGDHLGGVAEPARPGLPGVEEHVGDLQPTAHLLRAGAGGGALVGGVEAGHAGPGHLHLDAGVGALVGDDPQVAPGLLE